MFENLKLSHKKTPTRGRLTFIISIVLHLHGSTAFLDIYGTLGMQEWILQGIQVKLSTFPLNPDCYSKQLEELFQDIRMSLQLKERLQTILYRSLSQKALLLVF